MGEKALPEGFADIFIKLKHPTGRNKYILVEIKTGKASKKDLNQLKGYIEEFKNEAIGSALIAKDFPKNFTYDSKMLAIKYKFRNIDKNSEYSYEKLFNLLELEVVK